MAEVLQALGVAYLAFMLYLTFLYYKRNNYSTRSFVFWIVVWLSAALLLIVPDTVILITQRLNIVRVLDFYMVLGMMFFSMLCFLSFAKVKKNEARIEELVRRFAIEKRERKRR